MCLLTFSHGQVFHSKLILTALVITPPVSGLLKVFLRTISPLTTSSLFILPLTPWLSQDSPCCAAVPCVDASELHHILRLATVIASEQQTHAHKAPETPEASETLITNKDKHCNQLPWRSQLLKHLDVLWYTETDGIRVGVCKTQRTVSRGPMRVEQTVRTPTDSWNGKLR